MGGNGRPIIPGQMAVETTFADGPLAQPTVVTMQSPGALKVLTIGGLTKAEALAGQIAGAIVANCDYERIVGERVASALPAIHALDIAEMILAESRRRAKKAQQQQNKPQIEGGDA